MKKLLALTLALMMACALLPVMAESADEYLGDWYLNEMASGDQVIPPSMLGMNMSMTINEDGTVLIVNAYGEVAEEINATWTLADGSLIVNEDGVDQTFTLNENGELVLAMDDGYMMFGREATEVEALPSPIPAETEDEFFGVWMLTTVAMGELIVPAELIGMGMTLTVEAGKATLTNEGEDGTVTELATMFTDGILVANEDDTEVIMELNDNGTISINASSEDVNMVLYFEAVAE